MSTLLVIEDEEVLARNLSKGLSAAGHEVRVCLTGEEGLAAAADDLPDLVLLDLRLPDREGLEVLRDLHEIQPGLPVILMTAYASVSDAVRAMRNGATDYLQKPLRIHEVRLLVERTLDAQHRELELAYLRARNRSTPAEVVGEDPQLLGIFEQAERLRSAALPPRWRPTILLSGETGTGKGLIAHAIHELLGGGPFIDVNCTALPAPLVEAELFGHERGTFTDAKAARAGLFAAAEGGALFLDEVGSLDLAVQAKFLKVIDEKRVRRIGATRDREVNVHIIAATNRDLQEAVWKGEFRDDLRHRLEVLAFEVPPLRERGGDVPLLARHFCVQLSLHYGGQRSLSPEAEKLLSDYPWPGNVRELRNVIERAVLISPPGEINSAVIAGLLPRQRAAAGQAPGPIPASLPPEPEAPARENEDFRLPSGGVHLEQLERELIIQAVERANGNRTRAAEMLGLTRDTLRYRLRKFGLG